jgi:hypothetical protein
MTGDEQMVDTGITVSYEIGRTVTCAGLPAFELVKIRSSPFAMTRIVLAMNEDLRVLERAIAFLEGKEQATESRSDTISFADYSARKWPFT